MFYLIDKKRNGFRNIFNVFFSEYECHCVTFSIYCSNRSRFKKYYLCIDFCEPKLSSYVKRNVKRNKNLGD